MPWFRCGSRTAKKSRRPNVVSNPERHDSYQRAANDGDKGLEGGTRFIVRFGPAENRGNPGSNTPLDHSGVLLTGCRTGEGRQDCCVAFRRPPNLQPRALDGSAGLSPYDRRLCCQLLDEIAAR